VYPEIEAESVYPLSGKGGNAQDSGAPGNASGWGFTMWVTDDPEPINLACQEPTIIKLSLLLPGCDAETEFKETINERWTLGD
jgi:hypothetical protein